MKNSPRTTVMGLLICILILVNVHWHQFEITGGVIYPEISKVLIAIFILLLGFFAMDEGTH